LQEGAADLLKELKTIDMSLETLQVKTAAVGLHLRLSTGRNLHLRFCIGRNLHLRF
jgi:hypothetical protein